MKHKCDTFISPHALDEARTFTFIYTVIVPRRELSTSRLVSLCRLEYRVSLDLPSRKLDNSCRLAILRYVLLENEGLCRNIPLIRRITSSPSTHKIENRASITRDCSIFQVLPVE